MSLCFENFEEKKNCTLITTVIVATADWREKKVLNDLKSLCQHVFLRQGPTFVIAVIKLDANQFTMLKCI